MKLRAKARRQVREITFDGLDAAESVPSDNADAGRLRTALARLTPDQRAILALHHLEGLPVVQIAETLAIPVGTAKSRLFAARNALVRALGEEDRP